MGDKEIKCCSQCGRDTTSEKEVPVCYRCIGRTSRVWQHNGGPQSTHEVAADDYGDESGPDVKEAAAPAAPPPKDRTSLPAVSSCLRNREDGAYVPEIKPLGRAKKRKADDG